MPPGGAPKGEGFVFVFDERPPLGSPKGDGVAAGPPKPLVPDAGPPNPTEEFDVFGAPKLAAPVDGVPPKGLLAAGTLGPPPNGVEEVGAAGAPNGLAAAGAKLLVFPNGEEVDMELLEPVVGLLLLLLLLPPPNGLMLLAFVAPPPNELGAPPDDPPKGLMIGVEDCIEFEMLLPPPDEGWLDPAPDGGFPNGEELATPVWFPNGEGPPLLLPPPPPNGLLDEGALPCGVCSLPVVPPKDEACKFA